LTRHNQRNKTSKDYLAKMLSTQQQTINLDKHTKGTVIVIHGFAEHAGRFENTVARLGQIGWSAKAITLKGHGKAGIRPDIENFDDYLQPIIAEINAVNNSCQEGAMQRPVILLGQSMGGLIASRIALSAHSNIAGLILSSPAFGVADPIPKTALSLLRFLGKIAPTLPLVPPPKGGAKALSQTAKAQSDFENDPLCWHGRLGPRMASEMAYASRDTEQLIHEISIPVLMLWGNADTVISPDAMLRTSNKISPQYLSKKIWPEGRHHLFTDLHAESHIECIILWLNQQWA
jgi:acylglycerol lipase